MPVIDASRLTDELSDFRVRCAEEYIVCLNKTEAYRRAGGAPKWAARKAYEVFRDPRVVALVRKGMKERSERTKIEADEVLRELVAHMRARANDLVEHRRNCCRFCYGEEHRYQETPHEREVRYNDYHEKVVTLHELLGTTAPPFDELGGTGFNKHHEPNPDCPECFGDGVAEVFVHDTRELDDDAERAFAGIKATRDGVEVRMHSKDKSMELAMRHLGLLNDKLGLQNPDGTPLSTGVVVLPAKQVLQVSADDYDDLLG